MHRIPAASENGQMAEKDRTKKIRPCDACRRRKSKCVVEPGASSCVLCRFHSQACTYLQAPLPRKRPGEQAADADPASPSKQRALRTKPALDIEIEEYDQLPSSLLKRTLGLQNVHHSRYVGLNDALDAYGQMGNLGGHGSLQQCVRYVHPWHAFRILPDAATEDYEHDKELADEVQGAVGESGLELVHLYFRIVHPSFPVLHKMVYLEKYARSHREFSPALLAAVYLLAANYWNYSEGLAQSPKPNLRELRRLAFEALQKAMKRPKLSTIQAGLLLSQIDTTADATTVGRLTSELVDVSYRLGLHLDATGWDIPDWETGLRRRLAWAVFTQDKWTALLEGRPSLLSEDDWLVRRSEVSDFPERAEGDEEVGSEVENGRLVFLEMVGLTEILADILTSVFSARSRRMWEAGDDPFLVLLDRVKPLQIRLKEWSVSVPSAVRMDTAASMRLSPIGYLRLAYLAVEVCIHRQLVRLLPMSQADNQILSIYRRAARERFDSAVEFVQRLMAQHVASFWHFASAHNCASIYAFGQALRATAPTVDEQTYFDKKLRQFKWALKVNSEAGATFMKVALSLIDQSIRIGSNGGIPSTTGATPSITTGTPAFALQEYQDSPTQHPSNNESASPSELFDFNDEYQRFDATSG